MIGGEVLTIPQGENSAEYATVGWKRAGGESSFLDCITLSDNFIYNGSSKKVNDSGNVLTGPDFVLEKGMKISGSVSLTMGAKVDENGAMITVYINNPNNYKTYSENVYINEGETSADYSVTVPANLPSGGYLVSYTFYYGVDGCLKEDYYSAKGTVPLEESATLVDVSIEDASGIRLALIPDNIAITTKSTVLVNGTKVAFEAYNIGGNNYFKLRDLAKVISGTQKQFDIGWDGAANAISITTGKPYTPVGGELTVSSSPANKTATATSSKIYLNGKEVQFTAYNIGGNNYFKLRDVAAEINFAVTWDGKTSTIGVDTSTGYVAP